MDDQLTVRYLTKLLANLVLPNTARDCALFVRAMSFNIVHVVRASLAAVIEHVATVSLHIKVIAQNLIQNLPLKKNLSTLPLNSPSKLFETNSKSLCKPFNTPSTHPPKPTSNTQTSLRTPPSTKTSQKRLLKHVSNNVLKPPVHPPPSKHQPPFPLSTPPSSVPYEPQPRFENPFCTSLSNSV